jgi:hypothetical protein
MQRLWMATVVALVGMCAVASASTGLGKATSFTARFTTAKPATPSGLVLKTTGAVPAAGVTLPAAVQQTVTLPAGTKLRLGKLPQCKASDGDIAAKGAEGACPRSSRVGSGGADGVLDGSATHFDVGIYAVRGHLVFAAEQNGMPLKQSFNGVARRGRLVLTVPTLGGRIAPTEFDAKIASRDGWLVTPKRCGHWVSRGRFQGVSGVGGGPVTPAQTLTDRLTCRG